MKKRDTIIGQADRTIKKDYNSNFYLDTMGLTEKVWLTTICKILDQRLVKIKKDLEKKLEDQIIF